MLEAGIVRNQRHAVIDTRWAMSASASRARRPFAGTRARVSGALPIPVAQLQHDDRIDQVGDLRRQAGLRQHLGDDDRREHGVAAVQRRVDQTGVGAVYDLCQRRRKKGAAIVRRAGL
jgi:hypothetical protein